MTRRKADLLTAGLLVLIIGAILTGDVLVLLLAATASLLLGSLSHWAATRNETTE